MRQIYMKKIFWAMLLLVGLAALITVTTSNVISPAVAQETVLQPSFTMEMAPAVLRTAAEMDEAEAVAKLSPAAASVEAPAPKPTMDAALYKHMKAQAASAGPLSLAPRQAAPGAYAPPIVRTFDHAGVDMVKAGGLYPPDTHGTVGPSHFVEITNSHYDIYSKISNTTTPVKSISLASLFGYFTQPIFDPRVVYDPVWKRYVVYAEAFKESSTVQKIFIAISKTSSPTGAYWIYHVSMPINTNFWDYGQLGMNQDAVFITGNVFDSTVTTYLDTWMFSIAKARLYNGYGWGVPVFTGLTTGTLAPPIVQDQNANAYFVAAPTSGSSLYLYRGNNLSNAFYATMTLQAVIPVTAYSVPPDAPQPGTAFTLDTLDSRFVNASAQYGDRLWNVHTINFVGFATPRFYQIETEGGGANTIVQSGFFFASGTSSDWNASIAANTLDEVFVNWSSTDAAAGINAQVRLSGRQASDPLGSIPAGSVLVQSPTFYTLGRWGDYSAVSLDPSGTSTCAAGRKAWIVNETIETSTVWGSQIGRIGFCL